MSNPIHIIGGGLAGTEAAWQLIQAGLPIILHEMRPLRGTEAHITDALAELVCSNSFRSDDATYNAVGLLHEEMRQCNSLIISCADKNRIPAGGALAVDRDGFSNSVSEVLSTNPLATIAREEIDKLPQDNWDQIIIATGPLTSPGLSESIKSMTGQDSLAFFDAIAPIIYTDSIDFSRAWYQSRYDRSASIGNGKDYINCPLNQEEYIGLIEALIKGKKTEFKEWELDTPYFEGCLPLEVMAERGLDTPRFGPLKPVGLTDPKTGRQPYAVVQLRQDNAFGTLYNMVGCQTKLKYQEQVRIFRMIPGLENAEFARLGGLHRNTFLNSPRVLDNQLRLKSCTRMRFAGQITGVEGYVESAAIGLLAGRFLIGELTGNPFIAPPPTTALGAILNHITGGAKTDTFQPMNVNFGLFPPLQTLNNRKNLKGRERKAAISKRALTDLKTWKEQLLSRSDGFNTFQQSEDATSIQLTCEEIHRNL